MAMMATDGAVLGVAGGAGGTTTPPAADAGTLADSLYGQPGGASPGTGADGGGAAPVTPAAAAEKPAEGEEKPKEGEQPELFDPAKLTVPEGMAIDQKGLELVAPVLKELGLDQSKGQQLIDAYIKVRQQELEGQMATQQQWQEQIKADKDFGGDKFEVNRDKANRLIDRFGDEQLNEYLASSGAGNNPAIFRFIARIAAVMGEDNPVIPSVAAGEQQQNVLATLYPEKKG